MREAPQILEILRLTAEKARPVQASRNDRRTSSTALRGNPPIYGRKAF
jgi:hypothetical protein